MLRLVEPPVTTRARLRCRASVVSLGAYRCMCAAHPFVATNTNSGAQLTNAYQPVHLQARRLPARNNNHPFRSAAHPAVTASTS